MVPADAGATSAPPARMPDVAPIPTARAGIPRQTRRSDANAGGTTGPARLVWRRARDPPAYVTPATDCKRRCAQTDGTRLRTTPGSPRREAGIDSYAANHCQDRVSVGV